MFIRKPRVAGSDIIMTVEKWQHDFLAHCLSVNDEEVRLMLWDTAGQEEFDAITKAYYRGKTHLPLWQI